MFYLPELNVMAPELCLLGMSCIVLLADLFLPKDYRQFTYLLAQLALLMTAALVVSTDMQVIQLAFDGQIIVDPLAILLKFFILLTGFFVFLYSNNYIAERNIAYGDFYVLGLFSITGMMILVSGYSFLTIYLGLELLSLPLYAMVALQRDMVIRAEAAMKYFVMGALASGMLLYGMSLLYGVTGSLIVSDVFAVLQSGGESQQLLVAMALVFIIVGFAFKLGAAPFHMWVPDVYQGAPTATTLMISSAPKLAAFAMMIRLLTDAMGTLSPDWHQLLIVIAILSMGIGNIVAIVQTNIKRLFAYSAISHIGFMLLGILTGTNDGYGAALFYMITYVITAVAGFAMVVLMSQNGYEAENIQDFKGLNARNPWYAFLMLIVLFSMAGVPPTVGFFAKLAVLEPVIATGNLWLAVVAVLFSVIGAYYYLRIVKVMYFDAPDNPSVIQAPLDFRVAISTNALAVLALGFFPNFLLVVCRAVFV